MPKLQNLRTSTASKRPVATNLDPGQIAINYEQSDPAIYFRAADDSLIKVAPLYIGSTAPNATPGSGGSSGNAKGELWLDTSNSGKVLKYWDGSAWQQVTASTITSVLGPTLGGTGQSTWTLGDLLYSNGTNTLAKLAGNTTSTKQFLTQTGTGTVSAAPSWGTVSKADVGLGNVENTALSTWGGSTSITTLGTISTGTVPAANVSGLASSATTNALDASNINSGTLAAARLGTTGTPQFASIGIGMAPLSGYEISLTGAYAQAATAVEALNIDCSTGNYFTKTINGNSTFTVSNVPATGNTCAFTLQLTHTSGTITWFSGVIWPGGTAPTLTTGKVHLFVFVTSDGGTTWRATSLTNYAS